MSSPAGDHGRSAILGVRDGLAGQGGDEAPADPAAYLHGRTVGALVATYVRELPPHKLRDLLREVGAAFAELADQTGGPVLLSVGPALAGTPAPSGPAERTWQLPSDPAAELKRCVLALCMALRGVALPAPAQAALDALIEVADV